MSIIIKQPMRENGISVSISTPDSSTAHQIKDIIESSTQGNINIKLNGNNMNIIMYPIRNLYMGGEIVPGRIQLLKILKRLLASFLPPAKNPIDIKYPSSAVGISVDINVVGGFKEFGEIQRIIQKSIKSNLMIEKSGFLMKVHLYPLSKTSIMGMNIYSPTDLLKVLNIILDKYIIKPDPTKGRNLNPDPRNIKGEPRILTKYEPTEQLEEETKKE